MEEKNNERADSNAYNAGNSPTNCPNVSKDLRDKMKSDRKALEKQFVENVQGDGGA